jgi:hypothetical protein
MAKKMRGHVITEAVGAVICSENQVSYTPDSNHLIYYA